MTVTDTIIYALLYASLLTISSVRQLVSLPCHRHEPQETRLHICAAKSSSGQLSGQYTDIQTRGSLW